MRTAPPVSAGAARTGRGCQHSADFRTFREGVQQRLRSQQMRLPGRGAPCGPWQHRLSIAGGMLRLGASDAHPPPLTQRPGGDRPALS